MFYKILLCKYWLRELIWCALASRECAVAERERSTKVYPADAVSLNALHTYNVHQCTIICGIPLLKFSADAITCITIHYFARLHIYTSTFTYTKCFIYSSLQVSPPKCLPHSKMTSRLKVEENNVKHRSLLHNNDSIFVMILIWLIVKLGIQF